MDRFIPREKLSKRERKALDSKKRVFWDQSPVTRRIESKKTYNRKKHPRWQEHLPGDVSFTLPVLPPAHPVTVPAQALAPWCS